MRGADPFDILRQANPVEPDQLADADSPQGQALLAEILEHPRKQPARAPLPRLLFDGPRRRYLVPAIAVLALGAGAVGWALTRGVGEPLTLGCYAAAGLQAKTAVVPADGRAPITACRELWRSGEFGAQPTPPLQACVLPSGAIGVFPQHQQDTCGALGLPPVPSTYEPAAPPAVRLKERLVDRFLSEECIDEQRARTLVETELARLSLTDWRIESGAPFTAARPCATLAFDTKRRVVLLVPAPPS